MLLKVEVSNEIDLDEDERAQAVSFEAGYSGQHTNLSRCQAQGDRETSGRKTFRVSHITKLCETLRKGHAMPFFAKPKLRIHLWAFLHLLTLSDFFANFKTFFAFGPNAKPKK